MFVLGLYQLQFQGADSLHVDVRRQTHDHLHRAHVLNSYPLYELVRVLVRVRVCVSY